MTEAETESLAEEIRLLVDMVVERAAPWLDGVISAGHGAAREEADSDACGWCPLCAIVAVVRGERLEFVARLMEHAAQLVALLRAVLADRWEPDQGVHMPGFRPPSKEDRTDRVQHISVQWQENG